MPARTIRGVRRGNFEIPTRGLRVRCSASELPALERERLVSHSLPTRHLVPLRG